MGSALANIAMKTEPHSKTVNLERVEVEVRNQKLRSGVCKPRNPAVMSKLF
jgi:hypothetical protein